MLCVGIPGWRSIFKDVPDQGLIALHFGVARATVQVSSQERWTVISLLSIFVDVGVPCEFVCKGDSNVLSGLDDGELVTMDGTGQLRYLEFKGNGENTSSYPKFEISK